MVHMKMELLPKLTYPAYIIITPCSHITNPLEVEEKITTPIEESVASIPNLHSITSLSAGGMSAVMAEFPFGTDTEKTQEIIEQNIAQRQLPLGAIPPVVMPASLEMLPVIVVGVGGEGIEPDYARKVAKEVILPELKEIKGASFFPGQEIMGGEVLKQVVISPDPQKMGEHKISFAKLTSILTGQEFSSLKEIEAMPLSKGLVLGDVASIDIDYPGGNPIAQLNGEPGVGIMVSKTPDANTVEVADRVKSTLSDIALPPGLGTDIIFDQSEYIKDSIGELTGQAASGTILAIIIVFLFLFVFRASLITALSIPLSIFLGFLLMYLCGLNINILTLGAIAVAVGKVIDNTIVVVENIYRHLKMGESFSEATIEGSREVAGVITWATLVMVVILIPILFIGGMVYEIFNPFAITLTLVLFSSLIIALTLVPALATFMRASKTGEGSTDGWYHRIYGRALHWSLDHRRATLITCVAVFLGSLATIPITGTYLLPEMEQEILMADTTLPAGSSTREVASKVAQAEEIIREDLRAKDYLSMGAGADVAGGGMMSFTSLGGLLYGANTTSFAETIVFLEKGANLDEERDKFNQKAEKIQGAEVVAYTPEELMNNMGMGTSSLAITISDKSKEEVEGVGKQIVDLLEATEGISGITTTIYEPSLQPFPQVDYERAQDHGISPLEVEEELSMMREDQLAGFAELPDREYEVYVKGLDLNEKEDFEGLYVGKESPILLTDIAEITEIPSPPLGIHHYNQVRAHFINATISGRDKGKVTSEVEDSINKTVSQPGVEIEIGGVEEMMEENFHWMLIAIVAAVVLLYFTITAIFRSFTNSGLIMLSLPLALIGALLSLFILQRPIGVVGLMGMMLEGIVLTNAIVLLVFVEQLRKKGMSVYDALIEGGKIRLRPILMTALTTIFALLPLSFGGAYGGVIVTDMAIVVIGGLLTSTILTLIVIPAAYKAIHRE